MIRVDGLTENEGYVMDALVEAFECYSDLAVEHPDEPNEFRMAVHRAQDLLAVRIVRRSHPEGWARFENGELV